eukprot:4410199-Lingulodinium_polyedra.AAC.1
MCIRDRRVPWAEAAEVAEVERGEEPRGILPNGPENVLAQVLAVGADARGCQAPGPRDGCPL